MRFFLKLHGDEKGIFAFRIPEFVGSYIPSFDINRDNKYGIQELIAGEWEHFFSNVP